MTSLPHGLRVLSSPLRKLLLMTLAAAACNTTPAQPVSDAPSLAAHPVVGTWSWPGFSGKCVETFQYRPNGTLLSTSGDAVVEWTFETTVHASEKGFYKVTEASLRQNGKRDCSGDLVDEDGDLRIRYIQLSPMRDRMIVCQSESLSACFGPLGRIE